DRRRRGRGAAVRLPRRHARRARRRGAGVALDAAGGGKGVRVMVVYAHPVETSFNAAIYDAVTETLKQRGHEIDACDLYAENFPAIMSRADRLLYHEIPANRALARPWIERLEAGEGLGMVFPTWVFAPPAILKGFCEKVFVPGFAFELVDGKVRGAMRHLKRVGGVSTYGGTRLRALLRGAPPPYRSRSWAATT